MRAVQAVGHRADTGSSSTTSARGSGAVQRPPRRWELSPLTACSPTACSVYLERSADRPLADRSVWSRRWYSSSSISPLANRSARIRSGSRRSRRPSPATCQPAGGTAPRPPDNQAPEGDHREAHQRPAPPAPTVPSPHHHGFLLHAGPCLAAGHIGPMAQSHTTTGTSRLRSRDPQDSLMLAAAKSAPERKIDRASATAHASRNRTPSPANRRAPGSRGPSGSSRVIWRLDTTILT
jgi:hypothetical protein